MTDKTVLKMCVAIVAILIVINIAVMFTACKPKPQQKEPVPSIVKIRLQTGTIGVQEIPYWQTYYTNDGCHFVGASYIDKNYGNVWCVEFLVGE